MKKITSVGNVHQIENPNTHVMENIPIFNVELVNRLKLINPNKDIELQFELGPIEYEKLYKKDLSFGSIEEMQVIRNLLSYMTSLDNTNVEYDVLNSPFTNSIVIATPNTVTVANVAIDTTKLVKFKFPNLNSYMHADSIMKWMTEQERHF